MKSYKYEQEISESTDLNFLKTELLHFRETNNRLNKRNQKLESHIVNLKYCCEDYRERIDKLEKMLRTYVDDNNGLQLKLLNIPGWIRSWFNVSLK